MFTVILSDESVNFFTFSLIYLCKSESQKVFAQFTDVFDAICRKNDLAPRRGRASLI
jgi:hypothetical protein